MLKSLIRSHISYIFIYPINISLYKPLRKVTNHATHPRNQPSRCRGTAAWDSAYSSALAARPDTSSGTMMDETDEKSIKKRLSEGLDQRISPEFNTKEVQSWSKQQKTTEFAFWYRRKITNIRINHLKTVSCHPCLALFGYPGSNLGLLRRVRFFCLSTKSEHHDDNSNRSSNSQTVPNWSSSLRGKTIRNQWPMDLGIQMGSPVFRRNLILGMSHEQICTWQLSCKAGLELNLPKIWNGQCCKPLEWYPQGSGLSIPPKWIQTAQLGQHPNPQDNHDKKNWGMCNCKNSGLDDWKIKRSNRIPLGLNSINSQHDTCQEPLGIWSSLATPPDLAMLWNEDWTKFGTLKTGLFFIIGEL